MKLSKKKVFALALAVCLIAVLSMGSLAWFTDDDSVTNDFLIAGSEDENPDDVFSVDVWEKDDPNSTDKIQDGIEYPNILPGDDWYKEVNVENTGSYEQYIRVTVTVSKGSIWQDVYGKYVVDLSEIANIDTAALYNDTVIGYYDAEIDSLVYVLYYENILSVDDVYTVFNNVHIPEMLDRDQAAQMAGGFNINVKADAVQTKNVGDNVIEAFTTVGMYTEIPVAPADLKDALPGGAERVILDPSADWSNLVIDYDIADVTIDANGTAAGIKLTGKAENVVITGIVDNDEDAFASVDLSAALAGSSVTVKNCYLVDKSGTPYGAIVTGENCDLTVDNCELVGIGKGYGIYRGGSSGALTITNSSFVGFGSWAIQVNGTTYGDVLIDSCEFIDCPEGIFKNSVTGAGHNGLSNGDFTFTNNTLTNCLGHDGSEANLFATKVTGTITISGNTRDGAAWDPTDANGIKQN